MTGSSIKSGHSGKSAAGSHHSSGDGHPRPVYLVAYRSATFKSHWGLFIPNKDDKRHKVGRLIHIEGSVQEGFIFEIRRNYDISKTRNVPYPLILLGTCSDHFLIDNAHTIRDGDYHKDHLARDPFEKLMASVPAPGKSLRTQADHSSGSGPPKRVVLSDCQWWISRCVEKLVAEHHLRGPVQKGTDQVKSPLEILKDAPKH